MKISRRQIRKILISESLSRGDKKGQKESKSLHETERIRLLVRKLLSEMYSRPM
jgi:hypothetical protein